VVRPLAAAALLLAIVQVSRAEVLGGGLPNTDCRLVFRGLDATNGNSGVVCTDGDPTCDADGVANGTCSFAVKICTGTTASGCDTATFTSVDVSGTHIPPPRVPSPDGTCGPPAALEVPVGTSTGTTVLGRDGNDLRDVDYLQLCCLAGEATPLEVARCALAVDLNVSGCGEHRIPAGVRLPFARARDLLKSVTAADSVHARSLKLALRKLGAAHGAAKRFAKHDQCGDALGLVVNYTQNMVGAARAAASQ
jgi:hypothetical protein